MSGTSARVLANVVGAQVRDYVNDMMAVLQSKGGAFNLSLAYSVGSNALTIAAKQVGGSNADADNPIVAGLRSATAGSGDYSVRSIQAALSMVMSSGSTLGHGNSDSRWTYVYLIDNAGTLELAVSSKFFGLQGIASTTAEGGAGGADSATTMYSTTARSNVPFLCVGRFKAPQTVGGTWAAVPTSAELWPFESLLWDGVTLDLSGANQGQIKFPAAQNASSDANTLDDYEEGTFTPGITLGGGNTGLTYSAQVGRYTKIGNRVSFSLHIILSNKGSSSGQLLITGLPFTANSTTNNEQSVAVALYGATGTTGGFQGYIAPGSTSVTPSYTGTGAPGNLSDGTTQNSTEFLVSGHYMI